MGALNVCILIIEDHEKLARHLARTFCEFGDTEIATSFTQAQKLIRPPRQWDGVCLDLNLSGECDGLTILDELRAYDRNVPVMILTGVPPERWLVNHIAEQGAFFVAKPCSLTHITAFGTKVASYSRQSHSNIASDLTTRPLSPRQSSVLALLLNGLSRKEIATTLDISIETANDHVKAVLQKTECADTKLLLARALRSAMTEFSTTNPA